jgi:hypothetical protein
VLRHVDSAGYFSRLNSSMSKDKLGNISEQGDVIYAACSRLVRWP